MFDTEAASIGLPAGEADTASGWCDDDLDDFAYLQIVDEWNTGWPQPDRHVLPDDLEDIAPGPFLAAIVSSVDPRRLNGHDAIRLMQARARLSSHHEAGKYRAMAEVAFAMPGDAGSSVLRSSEQVDYASVEVAAALTLTRRASEAQLDRALSLTGHLPRVLEAFSAGRLDPAKVRLFDQSLGHLPEDIVDTVLDRVLEEAPELTTGQLRARLARLVLEADPDGEKASFQAGLEERKVASYGNPDHTANLGVFQADPAEIAEARSFIESLARSLKTEGEARSMDQLRADVALDLLQGKHPVLHTTAGGGGGTHVTASLETLAGLSDKPGMLEGYGAVFAEIARKTAARKIDDEWTFTVTDQGRPVATGTLARRPTASQNRQIAATYPTCVFPGCREPVYTCDLDHRKPRSQGGPTHNDNLAPLCRFHHMTRHHTPWQVERLPSGDHQWTSPLGHTYITKRGPPES